MSLITDESKELINQYLRTLTMKEFGAAPYGGNLNKWPAKLVDAFVVLNGEHVSLTNKLRHRSIPINQGSISGKGRKV